MMILIPKSHLFAFRFSTLHKESKDLSKAVSSGDLCGTRENIEQIQSLKQQKEILEQGSVVPGENAKQ